MAKTDNLTDFLTGVAGAIRTKKGTTALINPQDFESEIGSINTAKPEQTKTLTVTENGTQTVKPDTGKVLSGVTVTTNVPATPTEEKTVDLAMASGNQVVTPASGKHLTKVTITKPTALAAGNIKSGVDIGGVTGTLSPAKTEQDKTVDLAMASGNQVVSPDSGKVLNKVTITKPATLVASNIKKGVTIGGVAGSYAPTFTTETKTVALAMGSGNQVISKTSGKDGMTQVTITKPSTMLPANIKKGVNIGGVTGTYEGESSGSSGGEEVWTLDLPSPGIINTTVGDYADQPFYIGSGTSKSWYKITVSTIGEVVAVLTEAPTNQSSSIKAAPRRASSNPSTNSYHIGVNDTSSNKFAYDSTLSANRKKMVFPKPVTGVLLEVLTTIAAKQPTDYAIQGYSSANYAKRVTITSNGTTTIKPDAPYDAMKDVSVTVNVAGKNKFRELVEKTITELTTEDFAGITTIGESVFAVCSQLRTVTIPNTITYIGGRAFNNCIALKNISFPDSITAISLAVLGGCSALTSFTIPNNVKTIGSSAFYGCEALTSLTIPSKVSSINSAALQIGTTEAKATITMLSTTPPTIATNTFKTARLEKIIVPKGTGATYKAATNWSALADYIQEATT